MATLLPGMYSITKYGEPSISPNAKISTTFSWRTRAIARASIKKRSRALLLRAVRGPDQLDRDLALQPLVEREHDHAHAALAERTDHAIRVVDQRRPACGPSQSVRCRLADVGRGVRRGGMAQLTGLCLRLGLSAQSGRADRVRRLTALGVGFALHHLLRALTARRTLQRTAADDQCTPAHAVNDSASRCARRRCIDVRSRAVRAVGLHHRSATARASELHTALPAVDVSGKIACAWPKFDPLAEFEARLRALKHKMESGLVERARIAARARRARRGRRRERAQALKTESHKLRGVAGSYGHDDLTELAGQLEQRASVSPPATVGQLARELADLADAQRRSAARRPGPEPRRGDRRSRRAAHRRRDPQPAQPAGAKLRVLAIDDDPVTQRLLSLTLRAGRRLRRHDRRTRRARRSSCCSASTFDVSSPTR